MMKQMVVTYDTEVLHTIKSFSNANNHELFCCAPPPFSEILDPPVVYIVIVTLQAAIPLEDDSFMQFS